MAKQVKLGINEITVKEANTQVSFVISEPTEEAFSVEISISDHPNAFSKSLLFLPGETTKSVEFPITPDAPLTSTLYINKPNLVELEHTEFRIDFNSERKVAELYLDEEIFDDFVIIDRIDEEIIPNTFFETISDATNQVDERVLLSDSTASTATTSTTDNTTTTDTTTPTVTSLSLSDTANSSVAENVAYSAAAPTLTGTPIGDVTYSLSGDDASLFSVATDGAVSMVGRDFESPADSGSNNTYSYTLVATDDDGNTASDEVTVTITNATLAMSDTANSSVAENVAYSAAAPTITGAPMGTVTYSLAGSDASLFSVAADGAVSMAGQDFENPADTGDDNVYHYTLIAEDEEVNTAYDQVYVTVTDAIEGDTTAPTVSSFSSTTSNGSYNAGDTINITATTSESVQSGNTITVTLDTGDTVVLTAASAGTTLTGTYTVGAGDTSSDLTVSSFSIGTVADTAGNAMTSTTVPSNNNIADSSAIVIDTTAPTLSSSSPADDATAVAVGSNIVLNFSEAVDVESGNIVIYKASDDSVVETIAVGSSQVTGTGTTQITINPTSDLASSTEYYVQIAATGFDDAAGNSYAGITDTASLSFTTAPTLSIDDVSYTESSSAGNATFTVTLSEASGQDVTVNYASSDVSATAGSDYTATSGTVTIAAGNTTATITVPILVDTLDESNETATLTLSNASNASISDATGTLTIVDDDGDTTASAATLTISTSGFSGATTTSVPSGASGLNAIVDSYLASNETKNGTSSADYIEIQDSANSNVGSISGGNGDDIIYIKGWGSAINSSVTGDGGSDTLYINPSIYSSRSNWNNNNGIKSGTIHFTNGGSITINNFEYVKGIWGSAGQFERNISVTATLNDTDGSESLSDITVSNLPDNTTVKDSDGNAVTVSSNAFTVDSVVSGTAQVFTLTKAGPFDFTANGAVTVTESNGGATTTTNSSVLIDGVVEGVEYFTTSGMSDLTNQEGLFNYQDGDDITFKIGGVVLGVATAEDVTSGRTFLQDIADVERSNLSDDYLENMAIFLQSLDANYNPGDGITITQQMRINLADIELDLRQASSGEVKQVIEQVGGIYVERAEAMEHVKDMLIEYSDMSEGDFELIDTESLVAQTESSQSDQQNSLSSIENEKITLEVLADLEDIDSNEELFSELPKSSQEYNASKVHDNESTSHDNSSVLPILNSVLNTIENDQVHDI